VRPWPPRRSTRRPRAIRNVFCLGSVFILVA
jgi:hypothetical protein